MRSLVISFALFACHKDAAPPPPAPTAPTPVGAPIQPIVRPDAQVALVPLLASVPAILRVSSRVKNPAILPEHLIDGDLETAWNSATGDLGAWVEAAFTEGTTIEQVRLTVGHTGHGPKGEDYFTMNPRIAQVVVWVDGTEVATVPLDITRRDLQTIPVHASGPVRLVVDQIERGTNKAWREIAISELEVWGTPPPGWKPHRSSATVEVGEVGDGGDPCAAIEAERAAFIKQHEHDDNSGPGGEDHNFPPRCDEFKVASAQLDPVWGHMTSWCYVGDEIYGPKTCTVQFTRGLAHASIEVTDEMQSTELKITKVTEVDVFPGGHRELVLRLALRTHDEIAVCRIEPKLACSTPIEVTGPSWTTRETFAAGALVLAPGTGSAPASVLGIHPLVFP